VTGHIKIYGEIGNHVTLDTVLNEIKPDFTDYVVHIISPGGDVFEGFAIYNALRNTAKNITVHIEGVCASIATLIAAAGNKIVMNTKSQFMIHNPKFNNMAGDARDLRNAAAQLEKIKSQLIDSWVSRTTLSKEQLSEMYDHETWLSPEQAMEFGFVDEVQDVLKAVATADIKKYRHMDDNKVMNAINSLGDKILSMFEKVKTIKNMTATLADGKVIMVESEDGDWTGKQVAFEDGTPLPPGEYKLTDGRAFSVGEGSVIEEVKEAQNMDADKKLAEAEARIKELESALQARTEVATQAEAKVKTMENKFRGDLKAVQDELEHMKNTTAGDPAGPNLGDGQQTDGEPPVNDPMKAWFKQNILDKRNTD
jgi:ATP-dependent Clp protease protease subunit